MRAVAEGEPVCLPPGRGALVSGLDASESLLEVARDRLPEGDFGWVISRRFRLLTDRLGP